MITGLNVTVSGVGSGSIVLAERTEDAPNTRAKRMDLGFMIFLVMLFYLIEYTDSVSEFHKLFKKKRESGTNPTLTHKTHKRLFTTGSADRSQTRDDDGCSDHCLDCIWDGKSH